MGQHYTIARQDNVVFVDQEARPVDCSALPMYFHALQWYGEAPEPYGEIEYMPDVQGKRMPNTRFSDFAPYQTYVDAWYAFVPPDQRNPELVEDETEAEADATTKTSRRKR